MNYLQLKTANFLLFTDAFVKEKQTKKNNGLVFSCTFRLLKTFQ